jgi:hypothetical protein
LPEIMHLPRPTPLAVLLVIQALVIAAVLLFWFVVLPDLRARALDETLRLRIAITSWVVPTTSALAVSLTGYALLTASGRRRLRLVAAAVIFAALPPLAATLAILSALLAT